MRRPIAMTLLAVIATPAVARPAVAQPAAAAGPAAQETIYRGEASSILGRPVRGPDGQDVGRIVDVLVDLAGQPRAAVIDTGGFMGVGTRRIAVAWRALHFEPDSGAGRITLEMTADQIKATPDYQPAGRPVIVAAPPLTGPSSTGPSSTGAAPAPR